MIKVFIDTNILISATLFPSGVTANAFLKAVSEPYVGYICDQNVIEYLNIMCRKFPDKTASFKLFFSYSLSKLILLKTPPNVTPDETKVRDITDRPLIRAAQQAHVDIFLTGDKDFLESKIDHPIVLSPSQFLNI